MGIKFKKRGGISTPPPSWKFESFDFQTNKDIVVTFLPNINTNENSSLSARKLGARLWESLPAHTVAEKMSHGGAGAHSRRRQKKKEKSSKVGIPYDEPPRPSDGSLKREITASVIQHHRSVQRNSRAFQTVSPASYNSSMEVERFNPPTSPHRFQGVEGKIGNLPFNMKTPNELAVVLHRIWTLEEQHASNISLINSLRKELDQSHVRMEVLQRQKNKEQERIKAKFKSIREELEDEKKLRRQSESLHMKLARDLSDTKTSFAHTLNEYEREKKARNLLENLFDEFARGIRDYEQEVRHLKQNSNKKGTGESPDKLIVHLSEAWLDERMQMKNGDEKGMIVDKLSLEIETFFRAKCAKNGLNGAKTSSRKQMSRSLRRLSSESFHLNEATGAPHKARDGEDSTSSDSNCFQSRLEEKPKYNTPTRKKASPRIKKGKNGVEPPRVKSNCVSNDTSKWASVMKDSTLKAKLLEARLEGKHSHLKAFGGSA